MLYKALLAIIALFTALFLIMYGDTDEIGIIIALGWITVLSVWARLAQAAEYNGERKAEHRQILEQLGWEPPAEEPQPKPWSPKIFPPAGTE